MSLFTWRQLLLEDYLRLIRLPNLFTVPSNILVGYFALVTPVHTNVVQLLLLVTSSILLYASGLVFNDYFDIQTDLKERPYRPLPSRKISKRTACTIGIASMISANLAAFLAGGPNSCAISGLVSAIVISYNYKLKKSNFGPVAMGLARSLNVVLGGSPGLYLILQYNNLLARIAFIVIFIFGYIYSISILSRKEVQLDEDQKDSQTILRNSRATVVKCFSIVFFVAACLIILVFLGIFRQDLFVNLSLFSAIIIAIFVIQTKFGYSSSRVRNSIQNMVIAIIVFDSIFVSGVAGLDYGLPILILVIPAVALSRRLYVT
jgi:4-hydroxybenzoate polyprenyltransferase